MSDDAPDIERRLRAVKAKRGYLLPHHGLMAIASPRLLDAYDACYTALALEKKVLDEHDRELVWLAVLIATGEALASHHIPKFRAAGGTDTEIEAVMRLTAWAVGAGAYTFIAEHWQAHLPAIDVEASYCGALATVSSPLTLREALLAVASVHAARGAWPLLARAIRFAYAEKVPEVELAEALSIMMFPGSVPRFVEAASVWRQLIRDGAVRASSAFEAWARLEGQGGFDEASGVKRR